jgi:hypothetical protein
MDMRLERRWGVGKTEQHHKCQPGTLVHTVHCELYSHVTLSHMISILVEYITALYSSLNTKPSSPFLTYPLLGPPTSDSYEPGIPALRCNTQIRLFTCFDLTSRY